MNHQTSRKRGGRPALSEQERRQKVTLMLTRKEIDELQREFEGHAVGFSVFCREKLLNREAITLSKPLDREVRVQLTNLLKLSGSFLLLAQKTRDNAPVSEDFRLMASQVKGIVQRVHYTVNEITYSQSFVAQVQTALLKMDEILGAIQKELPENEKVRELADLHKQLWESLLTYLKQYQIKTSLHDR